MLKGITVQRTFFSVSPSLCLHRCLCKFKDHALHSFGNFKMADWPNKLMLINILTDKLGLICYILEKNTAVGNGINYHGFSSCHLIEM